MTDEASPAPSQGLKAQTGCGPGFWAFMALPFVLLGVLIVVALVQGGGEGGNIGDSSARQACGHFRNIAGDAADGTLGSDQLLPKIREVNSSASVSDELGVKTAARNLLAAVTAGDDAQGEVAAMSQACSAIGE